MKQIRLLFKLAASYIVANKKLFLIVAAVSFCLIYFFPQIKPILFRPKPYIYGYAGNYTVDTLPRFIQDQISFGLTKIGPNNTPIPGAAVSWEATDSGKTVVFILDKNISFQDGQKFIAAQVNYNLKGVDVTIVNDYEIKLTLKEAFAPLPALLSQPIFRNGLIGLGDNEVVSVKSAGRFLASLELKNIKTSKFTEYKFYPSEQTVLTALKLGAIDSALNLREPPPTDVMQQYKVDSHIDGNTEAILFYNTAQTPLDDKTVRQGLTYALPDSFSYGEAANSPLPLGNWAISPAAKEYLQNLAQAKKSLKSVATESGGLKLNIIVSHELVPVAKTIAEAWKEVGVDTSISESSYLPTDFDAYLTYIDLPPDPDQYVFWHSTRNTNISSYKSPKVDKLLEEGRKALTISDRKDIYASFQKAITEDVPADFLFYPKVYTVSRH